MKLSIVILNYNVRYFLEHCLLSVQKAVRGLDAEIIVADNASSDGSCEMVRERFPEVKLLANRENLGFSKANNQAVDAAQGEYVCILNPDTLVAETTFVQVLRFAEQQPDFGAIGIRYLDGTGAFLPESKRNLPTPLVSLCKILGIRSQKYSYYDHKRAQDQNGTVSVLAGAFMLIKKERYQAVGGFDEDYFMYGEDIDLSYKLEQAGHPNYYLGQVTMLHYKGESTTKDAVYRKRFYGAMRMFYQKHFQHSFPLRWVVHLGVGVARVTGFLRGSGKQLTQKEEQTYWLFGNDTKRAAELSEKLGAVVKPVDEGALDQVPPRNALLIFDAAAQDYETILQTIQRLHHRNFRFRILPPGCDYLIGSDCSNGRGEVIALG